MNTPNMADPALALTGTLTQAEQAELAGLLLLRVEAIRRVATDIHLIELVAADGSELPAFEAGGHIDLHLGNGMVRPYSLANSPKERQRYLLGIKLDQRGRGGSRWIHQQLRVGQTLQAGRPRQNFRLDETAPHSVLIAGGIGITPIASMIASLETLGRRWTLHYAVRTADEAAFLDPSGDVVLTGAHGSLHLHVDAQAGALLDVEQIVQTAGAADQLYCCGPAPMLDAFERAAAQHAAGRWHIERFTAATPADTSGGYMVELARSARTITVPPGQTLLEALRGAGLTISVSCEQGICGTCETRVIAGRPDHRDSLLSDEEKASNEVMMVCCSGSLDPKLVLDL